jgi:hypothetical protein
VPQLVETNKYIESGFLFMGRVNNAFVKVYQAWRGKTEDTKTDKWPSNEEVLLEAVERMKSIHLQKR